MIVVMMVMVMVRSAYLGVNGDVRNAVCDHKALVLERLHHLLEHRLGDLHEKEECV